MPRALQRKLIDCKTMCELAAVAEALKLARIPWQSQFYSPRQTPSWHRVFVYVAHLQRAREILQEIQEAS